MSRIAEVESRFTDVNPPVLLNSLTSGENKDRLHLSHEVYLSLGTALEILRQNGLVNENLAAYYLKDERGIVTHLEIRDLPAAVAIAVHKKLTEDGLGGFIKITRKSATVGLPHPVNTFKRVPVIEVR